MILLQEPSAGEIESRQESFGGLGAAIIVAVFLTLAILALIEPGFFKTALVGEAAAPGQTLDAYRATRERVHARLRAIEDAAPPPTAVADLVLRLARNPDPPLRSLIGKEKVFAYLKRFLPFGFFEPGSRKFWRLSA